MTYTYPVVERFAQNLGHPIPVQKALFQTLWRFISLERAVYQLMIALLATFILYTRFVFASFWFLLRFVQSVHKTEFVERILNSWELFSSLPVCFSIPLLVANWKITTAAIAFYLRPSFLQHISNLVIVMAIVFFGRGYPNFSPKLYRSMEKSTS